MEAEIARVREESPQSPVILAQGLGAGKIFYFRENRDRFPGVTVERVFTRDYRQGDIAAHLFGNVGEVTAEQLDLPRYGGLEQGDSGRPVRHRVRVRPLPARPAGSRPLPGGRPRPPDRPARQRARVGGRQRPADDRLRPAGPGRRRARLVRAARRLRRDERRQRRDPGDGLGARASTPRSSPGRSPSASTRRWSRARTTRRSRTAPPRASIRRARSSSPSPRSPR